jgi:hypothetical protein
LVIDPDVSKNINALIFRVMEFKKECTSRVLTAIHMLDPEDEGTAMI